MSNMTYVAAAYILTWSCLGGFAIYLVARHRRAAERLADVASNTETHR